MQFSKFVLQVEDEDKTILFNTYNKALVTVEDHYLEQGQLKTDFPSDYLAALDQMGFFISDHDADELIAHSLDKDRKLMLSVEVALGCNMRCPYCYQGTEKTSGRRLSDESISDLIRYCELTSDKYEFDEVVLKVLGGEPTIAWDIVRKVINGVADFTEAENKRFKLMIDTNGVLVDDILALDRYDSLLLTVPLTYRDCHDSMRKLAGGGGSYDTIVANLNKIHRINPDITLVLRHNTDGENIKHFEEYIRDIRSELEFNPIIDLSYTTQIGNNEYRNDLRYEEFIRWKSSDAIDILVDNDCNVMVTPLMSTDRCQHRSDFSLKLFSDGTVGSCAMAFFADDRIGIGSLCDDPGSIDKIKSDEREMYQKCRSCRSFFLCGGGYNLPCIRSLGLDDCAENGAYNLDVGMFLKKYIRYKKAGKESLFIGFNKKMVIR